jgi:hypothetical protein
MCVLPTCAACFILKKEKKKIKKKRKTKLKGVHGKGMHSIGGTLFVP